MPSAVCLVVAIIAVGLLALIAIVLKGNNRHSFDKEEYQTRWLKVENSLKKDEPNSYAVAVMNGDKLLDKAMIEMGIGGKTMGERLKRSDNRLSDINKVWYAHKIRNQIAHEPDSHLDYTEASKALASFKRALKDLGAI